jgi:hypothetical protein
MTTGEFTAWLRDLLLAPLPPQGGEEAWFLQNKQHLDAMNQADLEIDEDFFHFVYHYVADADIRRRDPSYRRTQDSALRRYLLMYEARWRAQSSRGSD